MRLEPLVSFFLFYMSTYVLFTETTSTAASSITAANGTTSKQEKAQDNDVDVSWAMGNDGGTITNIFIGTTQSFSDNDHPFHRQRRGTTEKRGLRPRDVLLLLGMYFFPFYICFLHY
jgi:hypothetical protein